MAEQIEQGSSPQVNKVERGMQGVLLSHGPASYKLDQSNPMSYFVQLKAADGLEATHWGVDLQRAVAEAGVAVGENIKLSRNGKRTVEIPVLDENKQITGYTNAERQSWSVEKLPSHTLQNEEMNMAEADVQAKNSNVAIKTVKGRIVAFGGEIREPNERFTFEIKDDAGNVIKADTFLQEVVDSVVKQKLDIGQAVEIEVNEYGELYGVSRVLELEPIERDEKGEEQPSLGGQEPENAIRQIDPQASQAENTFKRASKSSSSVADESDNDSISNAAKAGAPLAQAPASLTTLLNGRFVRGEDNIYRRIGEQRPALADEGERIRFIDKQMDAFEAGVELAKAKGWEAIEVTGTDKFRAEAWFYAKTAGLEVVGYEPKEADLKRLAGFQEKSADNGRNKASIEVSADVVASKEQAERFAFNNGLGVQGINVSRGRYSGKLLHETDHHVVQEIGGRVTAIHLKSDLDPAYRVASQEGRSFNVQYQQGRGTIQQNDKSRERGGMSR